MSAIACLRIAVGTELRFADNDRMAPLVAKVASAYLETTWLWPRRFGLIAPFAFLLTDPRATNLDARELQAMAMDLQLKLFGQDVMGDVCLLLLEGDQTEVMHFAGLHLDELQPLLEGRDAGGFTGRVCKITPNEVVGVVPQGGPVEGTPPLEELNAAPAAARPQSASTLDVGWWGIYHLGRDIFVGSRVIPNPNRLGGPLADPDDPFALERDLIGLRAVGEALSTTPSGILMASFCFSTLIRASMRAAMLPALEALPTDQRQRLGVLIRHVPREPTYPALSTILRLFKPYFGMVNLVTNDPDFRIDCVPPGNVNSVGLTLAARDPRTRLAAIRRFVANEPGYRGKRIGQAITNVVTPAELELCRLSRVHIVAGPAVSDLLPSPCTETEYPYERLPYPNGGKARRQGRRGDAAARPAAAPPA